VHVIGQRPRPDRAVDPRPDDGDQQAESVGPDVDHGGPGDTQIAVCRRDIGRAEAGDDCGEPRHGQQLGEHRLAVKGGERPRQQAQDRELEELAKTLNAEEASRRRLHVKTVFPTTDELNAFLISEAAIEDRLPLPARMIEADR
jgi:hypothetical protein